MAQTPDQKTAAAPANTGISGETERKPEAANNQVRDTGRALAATAQRTGDVAAQATREAGHKAQEGAMAASHVAQASAQAGDATARRGLDALAQGQRQLLEGFAERYAVLGRQMAQSIEETTSDLRSLMVPPADVVSHVRDWQNGMADLATGVLEANIRASQEVLRVADPLSMFGMQRRFMRDYLDSILQATGTAIRVTHQAAEETLRPIEARIGQRQHNRQDRQGQSKHQRGVVSDVMTADVQMVTPEDTVQQATRLMRDEDTGILPVGEGDRLVGVVTDRDVTLRLVAEGKDPARTKVREVMSQDLKYVYEDEDLTHVADNMAEQQIRRLPVVNRSKRLVGIVSLGDLSRANRSGSYAGRAMRGVARVEGGQIPASAAE